VTARCGRVMRRYEKVHGALPEAPECGRPAGHNGPCRSVLAMVRDRPKMLARQAVFRRRRREAARQAGRRAVLAAAVAPNGTPGRDMRAWERRHRERAA